jgi:hypothetical protein
MDHMKKQMTLKQWLKKEQKILKSFQTFWETAAKRDDSDTRPRLLSYEDWYDRYASWCMENDTGA